MTSAPPRSILILSGRYHIISNASLVNNCIIFDSCHPKHIKLSIPYSLARRLRMIISSDEKIPQRMLELKHTLLKQKYPENVINAGIQRALNLNRSELRQVRQNPEDNVVTYVSTFNPKIRNCLGLSFKT